MKAVWEILPMDKNMFYSHADNMDYRCSLFIYIILSIKINN